MKIEIDLTKNIKALADKAEKAIDSSEALKYSQAALNLAHVHATIVNANRV